MKLILVLSGYGLEAQSEMVSVVDSQNEHISFCHVCTVNFEKCQNTGFEGYFYLEPYNDTDSLVFSHISFDRKTIAIADIGSKIVLHEKLEHLGPVYVFDQTPLQLVEKALQTTKPLIDPEGIRKQIVVMSFLYEEDSLIRKQEFDTYVGNLDSLLMKDFKEIGGEDRRIGSIVFSISQLRSESMNFQYLSDYDYEIKGFFSKGFVVRQQMPGLKDRFYIDYYISEEFYFLQMDFHYLFDFRRFTGEDFLAETRIQSVSWTGNIRFDTKPKFVPATMTLERKMIRSYRLTRGEDHLTEVSEIEFSTR